MGMFDPLADCCREKPLRGGGLEPPAPASRRQCSTLFMAASCWLDSNSRRALLHMFHLCSWLRFSVNYSPLFEYAALGGLRSRAHRQFSYRLKLELVTEIPFLYHLPPVGENTLASVSTKPAAGQTTLD